MSLYGALYTGVTGLNGQSNAISIISDNIANVNTVGYKAGSSTFETLVTNTAAVVAYSPGGVVGGNRQLVDQQGILQTTNSATDLAISGAGFFVVNERSDGSGQNLYTRAGSFKADATGNFVNVAGFYLRGWPLDRNGLLPGEAGNTTYTTASSNIQSLQTVNLSTSSGVATATTQVDTGINLKADQVLRTGGGDTFQIGNTATTGNNYDITSTQVIAPDAGPPALALADQFDVTTTEGQVYTFEYGGVANSGALPIYNAASSTTVFTGPANGDQFTITTATLGTVTFEFQSTNPNIFGTTSTPRQFNSLATLAQAIDNVTGLTARVVNNVLYVSPDAGNDGMTFADVTGTLAADIGFANTATFVPAGTVVGRYSTMQELARLVNTTADLSATINNPTSASTVAINSRSPINGIRFDNVAASNSTTAGGATYFSLNDLNIPNLTTATGATMAFYGPLYDPTRSQYYSATGETYQSLNMAGSTVVGSTTSLTPDTSQSVTVYDALGDAHDLRIGFLKTNTNEWSVEIWATNTSDVTITSPFVDGQLATGTLTFNGDGSLRSVSSGLLNPVTVRWTNGAEPSELTFNWGTAGEPFGTVGATTIGKTDGMSQFAGDYNTAFINQNGAPVGQLIGVTIDKEGYVIGNYSNGETQRLYKLPLADFENPNALNPLSGNVFQQSRESGVFNLREANSGGVGSVISAALESSNADLAKELTDLIIAQRAYQANTKVISTSDQLLDELNRI
ncbi:MAG: flagellar hook-basal body complex protein [Alphaproteobacteria bacterium]|nr:flagellar hook-basal body complex protein [Alphaproteobacteria bacterium]